MVPHEKCIPVQSMSATATMHEAAQWARRIEDHEAARLGIPVSEARAVAARKAGIGPGTLANLRHGRVKTMTAHLRDRLAAAVVRVIETEIARLEHELEIARRAARRPDEARIRAAETALAAARQALEG